MPPGLSIFFLNKKSSWAVYSPICATARSERVRSSLSTNNIFKHAGRTFSCNQAYATETTYLSSRAESHRLGKPIPINTFGDRTIQA